jgi:hypothetical protein
LGLVSFTWPRFARGWNQWWTTNWWWRRYSYPSNSYSSNNTTWLFAAKLSDTANTGWMDVVCATAFSAIFLKQDASVSARLRSGD